MVTDDRVLVTGGCQFGCSITVSSAEVYDPATDTWSIAGSMAQSQVRHTVTLLADGRVLFAGGVGEDGSYLSSIEVYDPSTNTWASSAQASVSSRGGPGKIIAVP